MKANETKRVNVTVCYVADKDPERVRQLQSRLDNKFILVSLMRQAVDSTAAHKSLREVKYKGEFTPEALAKARVAIKDVRRWRAVNHLSVRTKSIE